MISNNDTREPNKMTKEVKAVILAAGKGTRMKADIPKVLHRIFGKPIVQYVAEACSNAGIEDIYIVVGFGADLIKQTLGSRYKYVLQEQQLGTAHALQMAVPYLKDYQGDLLVLVGDSPFITSEVLQQLITKHQHSNAAATFITTEYENTPPYGRVIRDNTGNVITVIEEKNALPEIKKIKEVLTSHYCFSSSVVLPLLSKIQKDPEKQEYYLTDIIEILINERYTVETVKIKDSRLVFGINDLQDLSKAAGDYQSIMKQNSNER